MKKIKVIFVGALSLVVFGLLLPQPIQALLVLFDSPVKDFFAIHILSLCVIVGLIQGLFEEGGYYFIFKTILKNEHSPQTPILFGIGRGGLHIIFDVVSILLVSLNLFNCIVSIMSRVFVFGAMIGLTMLDYYAYQRRQKWYLLFSILLHACLNGILYAGELNLIKTSENFEALTLIIFSCVVIICTRLVGKYFRHGKE